MRAVRVTAVSPAPPPLHGPAYPRLSAMSHPAPAGGVPHLSRQLPGPGRALPRVPKRRQLASHPARASGGALSVGRGLLQLLRSPARSHPPLGCRSCDRAIPWWTARPHQPRGGVQSLQLRGALPVSAAGRLALATPGRRHMGRAPGPHHAGDLLGTSQLRAGGAPSGRSPERTGEPRHGTATGGASRAGARRFPQPELSTSRGPAGCSPESPSHRRGAGQPGRRGGRASGAR